MDVVRDISDWVIVMAEGEIIAEGPPAAIGANQAVIDAYLGSSHTALTEEILAGHVPSAAELEAAIAESDVLEEAEIATLPGAVRRDLGPIAAQAALDKSTDDGTGR
jgi:branched-chain amino acid transport system ATP-binding protein